MSSAEDTPSRPRRQCRVETPKTPELSTPKRAGNAKRLAAKTETDPKPVKKAGRGRRRTSVTALNLDGDDPFNFDVQGNNHPEPLQNFSVLKSNFGDMKFTRSPNVNAENRYAKTEEAVTRTVLPTFTSGTSSPVKSFSITEMSTTPSSRRSLKASAVKSANKQARTKSDSVSETEKSPRKKNRDESSPLFPTKTEVKITVPELNEDDQVKADFSAAPYPEGMRVYALWGKEYYPARIVDRDGLGRYNVVFTEDEKDRLVPPTGIIPLASLRSENQLTLVKDEGEDASDAVVEIISVPSEEQPSDWFAALFSVKDVESNEVLESVSWKSFFINKEQQKKICVIKNTAVVIASDNVVPRSTRRSRVSQITTPPSVSSTSRTAKVTATPKASAVETPRAIKTPGKRGRRKKVVEPEIAEEADDVEEKASDEVHAENDIETDEMKVDEPSEENEHEEPAAQLEDVENSRKRSFEEADKEETTPPAKKIPRLSEEKTPVKNGGTELLKDSPIFEGIAFMLTSSARRATESVFNKRDYKNTIEDRGGVVAEEIDEFGALIQNKKAFLVADAFYRTHKYLFALAASVPCVQFKWIDACVEAKALVDHTPFMLPAGASVVTGVEFPWKPLKGELFKDKTIFVHSVQHNQQNERVVPFAEIWRPLLNNLGAKVVVTDASTSEDVIKFIEETDFHVMLTDRSCTPEIVRHLEKKEIPAVSSNWIIHMIITGGEWEPVSAHASFSPTF